jgi:hypothetical protein
MQVEVSLRLNLFYSYFGVFCLRCLSLCTCVWACEIGLWAYAATLRGKEEQKFRSTILPLLHRQVES